QRASLEQHAPAAAHRGFLVGLGTDRVVAEHPNLAGIGDLQPDDRAHQHRFAGTRAADNAENLAPLDLEREIVVDHLRAERVAQPLDLDRIIAIELGGEVVAGFFEDVLVHMSFVVRVHPQPTSVKNTAKNASSTMTMKIACTTAIVVRRPTCSESPFTCMP